MAADLHMLLMWVFIPWSSWTITPRSRALETDRMGISETVIDSDDGNLSRGLTLYAQPQFFLDSILDYFAMTTLVFYTNKIQSERLL